MKEPTYQEAIAKAWQVVWHHKILWVLGLLAALLGQFGLGDFFSRIWLLFAKGSINGSLFWTQNTGLIWPSAMSWQNVVGIVWLAGLVLALFIGLVVLAVISQGALIAYITFWFKNKSYSDIPKAWNKGAERFWSVLGVNVVYKITLCLLLVGSSYLLKLYFGDNTLILTVALVIILSLALFLYLVVSIVYIYTLGYVVVENKKFFIAVNKAWRLFIDHILVSFEVGILLMFLNLFLVLVAVSSLLLAFLPSLIIWIVAGLTNLMVLGVLGLLVGLFLWLLLVVLIGGFFNAFTTGAWMYLFMKMHKEGMGSRVLHWTGKLFKRK